MSGRDPNLANFESRRVRARVVLSVTREHEEESTPLGLSYAVFRSENGLSFDELYDE
jgi:hypothetical protein